MEAEQSCPAAGEFAQEVVAELVAERVVEALEVIKVEDGNAQVARRARGMRDLACQLFFERTPVQETGQRVAACNGAHGTDKRADNDTSLARARLAFSDVDAANRNETHTARD